MKRLMTYLKPHRFAVLLSSVLVLLIVAVDLYRPIIIGDAIDQYINGPKMPINTAFRGILTAAGYYLFMLLLGFVFNACNTWNLQKMGQKSSIECVRMCLRMYRVCRLDFLIRRRSASLSQEWQTIRRPSMNCSPQSL